MTEAKIELDLGTLSFSGEGEQEWLAQQLDKIIEAAPGLTRMEPSHSDRIEIPPQFGSSTNNSDFIEPLATYIKAKDGDSSQVQRFLATADWLRRRGETKLTTAVVTKALRENHQKRLSNPADCLNKNVAKGYCEKQGNGFFITPDGLKALGHKS